MDRGLRPLALRTGEPAEQGELSSSRTEPVPETPRTPCVLSLRTTPGHLRTCSSCCSTGTLWLREMLAGRGPIITLPLRLTASGSSATVARSPPSSSRSAVARGSRAWWRPKQRRPRPNIQPSTREIDPRRISLVLRSAVGQRGSTHVSSTYRHRGQQSAARRTRLYVPRLRRQLARRDLFHGARSDASDRRPVDNQGKHERRTV